MSSNNVTYFLGAGASAGTMEKPAIPILNKFNDALKDFFTKLVIDELNYKDPNRDYLKSYDEINLRAFEAQASMIKNRDSTLGNQLFSDSFIYLVIYVGNLIKELDDHTTVDTLARKYYLQGVDGQFNLIILKAFLSIYFLHLQHNENRFDMRYDSFVSTLLERGENGNLVLPNNIKVISWNYDLQFEIALKNYMKDKLSLIHHSFNIHPSMSRYNMSSTLDNFGMVKLNGTAGLFVDLDLRQIRDIDEIYPNEISSKELFNLFFDICRSGRFSIEPFYRYSWEDDNPRFDDLLPNMKAFLHEYAKDIMRRTNHLVVIGYSFPPFNRRLDIELFNELPMNAVVYIQDKNPLVKKNVEDIFTQFKFNNITVEFIEDTSQFHIPPIYFEG